MEEVGRGLKEDWRMRRSDDRRVERIRGGLGRVEMIGEWKRERIAKL